MVVGDFGYRPKRSGHTLQVLASFLQDSIHWTVARAEVSYEFGSVRSSVCQLANHGLRIDSSVLYHFLLKIRQSQNKKVMQLYFFLKKSPIGLGGPKYSPKMRFSEFWQEFNPAIFLLEYQSTYHLLTFCKKHMCGKNLVLDLWPKNLQTNQNVVFLNTMSHKGELFYRRIKFMLLFQVFVFRHAWGWTKLSQLQLKNDLSSKVFFGMLLRIHRSDKFVPLFQVGWVKQTCQRD